MSQFFHTELSAVRALSVASGTNRVEQLVSFIKNDKSSDEKANQQINLLAISAIRYFLPACMG